MFWRCRYLSREADLITGGTGTSQGPGLGSPKAQGLALPVRGLAMGLLDLPISLLWEVFNSQYFGLLKFVMAHRNYFLQKNTHSDSEFGSWYFHETPVSGCDVP